MTATVVTSAESSNAVGERCVRALTGRKYATLPGGPVLSIITHPCVDLALDWVKPDGGDWSNYPKHPMVNWAHGIPIARGAVEHKALEFRGDTTIVAVGTTQFFKAIADLDGIDLTEYESPNSRKAVGKYTADECRRAADDAEALVRADIATGVSIEFEAKGLEGKGWWNLPGKSPLCLRPPRHFEQWTGFGYAHARMPVNQGCRTVLADAPEYVEKAIRVAESGKVGDRVLCDRIIKSFREDALLLPAVREQLRSTIRVESTPPPAEPFRQAKTTFTEHSREKLARSGAAMKNGSFPIRNTTDLHHAIRAVGRAYNKAAAKAHIVSRAEALGAEHMLPEDWQHEVKAVDPVDVLAEKARKLSRLAAQMSAAHARKFRPTGHHQEVKAALEESEHTADEPTPEGRAAAHGSAAEIHEAAAGALDELADDNKAAAELVAVHEAAADAHRQAEQGYAGPNTGQHGMKAIPEVKGIFGALRNAAHRLSGVARDVTLDFARAGRLKQWATQAYEASAAGDIGTARAMHAKVANAHRAEAGIQGTRHAQGAESKQKHLDAADLHDMAAKRFAHTAQDTTPGGRPVSSLDVYGRDKNAHNYQKPAKWSGGSGSAFAPANPTTYDGRHIARVQNLTDSAHESVIGSANPGAVRASALAKAASAELVSRYKADRVAGTTSDYAAYHANIASLHEQASKAANASNTPEGYRAAQLHDFAFRAHNELANRRFNSATDKNDYVNTEHPEQKAMPNIFDDIDEYPSAGRGNREVRGVADDGTTTLLVARTASALAFKMGGVAGVERTIKATDPVAAAKTHVIQARDLKAINPKASDAHGRAAEMWQRVGREAKSFGMLQHVQPPGMSQSRAEYVPHAIREGFASNPEHAASLHAKDVSSVAHDSSSHLGEHSPIEMGHAANAVNAARNGDVQGAATHHGYTADSHYGSAAYHGDQLGRADLSPVQREQHVNARASHLTAAAHHQDLSTTLLNRGKGRFRQMRAMDDDPVFAQKDEDEGPPAGVKALLNYVQLMVDGCEALQFDVAKSDDVEVRRFAKSVMEKTMGWAAQIKSAADQFSSYLQTAANTTGNDTKHPLAAVAASPNGDAQDQTNTAGAGGDAPGDAKSFLEELGPGRAIECKGYPEWTPRRYHASALKDLSPSAVDAKVNPAAPASPTQQPPVPTAEAKATPDELAEQKRLLEEIKTMMRDGKHIVEALRAGA